MARRRYASCLRRGRRQSSVTRISGPWKALIAVFVCSFAVLLYAGQRVYREAPPIFDRMVTPSGEVLIDQGEVMAGQRVWQAMGGMQVGSVWGHGSYVAPDWTADYLHREALLLLDAYAKEGGAASYEALDEDRQAALRNRLQREIRISGLNASTNDLVVSEDAPRLSVSSGSTTRRCSATARPSSRSRAGRSPIPRSSTCSPASSSGRPGQRARIAPEKRASPTRTTGPTNPSWRTRSPPRR